MPEDPARGSAAKWPNVNFPAESVMFKRRDAFKNVVTDEEGNPVWFPRIDPMLDASGKPVTTVSGHALYRALVKLPKGTTLRGLDLTGFMISVPINERARERQAQGLPFNVALNPDRELMVFRYVEGRRESLTPDLSGTTDLWELVRAVSHARRAAGTREEGSPERVAPTGGGSGGRGGVEDPGRLVPPREAPQVAGEAGDGRKPQGPTPPPGGSAQAGHDDDDDGFELGYVPEPWELWQGTDQERNAGGDAAGQAHEGAGRSHDEAKGPAGGTDPQGRERPPVPSQVEVAPAGAKGQAQGQGRPSGRTWRPRNPVMKPMPAAGVPGLGHGGAGRGATPPPPARERPGAGDTGDDARAVAREAGPDAGTAEVQGEAGGGASVTSGKRPGGAFGYAPIGSHIGPPKVWSGRDGGKRRDGGEAR